MADGMRQSHKALVAFIQVSVDPISLAQTGAKPVGHISTTPHSSILPCRIILEGTVLCPIHSPIAPVSLTSSRAFGRFLITMSCNARSKYACMIGSDSHYEKHCCAQLKTTSTSMLMPVRAVCAFNLLGTLDYMNTQAIFSHTNARVTGLSDICMAQATPRVPTDLPSSSQSSPILHSACATLGLSACRTSLAAIC
ncbi:hypothetical protein K491DRAFT_289772 [Lophiostoma macrostomum CBS 122681]|uniref:Uncharacterized protein n=1 Tax=Lophiostoma macrostomum CBS 122681 TaxID=1314788 RepID=A0A6A6TFK0_9PLEO|nr:hypothetical protein K491DRAFT_289772 [Lophiostoma macrostomum CBS 122681]